MLTRSLVCILNLTVFLLPLSGTALPEHDEAVLIGYFGPNDPNHPEGGDIWCAASLAIAQANQAGGFDGRPFRLVTGWSENPWGSGVKALTRMAYQDRVWAMIGGIDGPSTHLAEQVVAKARLPLLSGANADRTANLANVTWMFSSLPGHHLQASALVDAMAPRLKDDRFVLVSAVDHDSHILTDELNKCFKKRQLQPTYHFEFRSNRSVYSELATRILDAKVKAVVLAAPMLDSAQLTVDLRRRGFDGLLFGGACLSRQGYLKVAGDAAEGAIFPLLYLSSQKAAPFEEAFFERSGRQANDLAAHTYDTVNLLIEAICQAGLDRQRIRDHISNLSPWQGVTGPIRWDRQGSNSRPTRMGTIKNGQVTPL